ncbi:hypothetical protein [Gordonia sihwensis]|uniref:hypothetical protein n=1 Tax=Gordonia sihwensis TaxID=173559 RepID=UPI0005EEBF56|nr:hypothetical protein [Gordonia sihwensis]KJR10492.1 hypothetical protein UG54_00385 [Gordonia sihwensis]
MQFEPALRAAERLVGANARRSDVLPSLKALLDGDGAVLPIPGEAAGDPVVCVDGAVISTQTDIVTWIAVAATNSVESASLSTAAVTTVGSHADAVRAAVMAAAELSVAVLTAEAGGPVWMDGSLATPLISIATSLTSVPSGEAAEFARCLRDLQVVESVTAYVDLAHAGQLRSLPKQDTSRSYLNLWAPRMDTSAQGWLRLQRDRILMGELLPPGFVMAPRPSPEVASVALVEPNPTELWDLCNELRLAMAGWDECDPQVTYLMPTDLDRPIKVEFTAAGDRERAADTAMQLAAQIDPLCHGPRMLEPYPQFVVDAFAKMQVQFANQLLAADISSVFGGTHPELVRAYRT